MLEITFGWFAFWCAAGVIWTGRGMICMLLAMLLHELGHLTVLAVYRIPVYRIRLGFADIKMETGPLVDRTELRCALAGPGVNLLLWVMLSRLCPPFGAVNLLLAGFNLLPLPWLDGGRAIRAAYGLLREK